MNSPDNAAKDRRFVQYCAYAGGGLFFALNLITGGAVPSGLIGGLIGGGIGAGVGMLVVKLRKPSHQTSAIESEQESPAREEIKSNASAQSVPGEAVRSLGLSQWQRLACTFTAPSKTFEDIKRGNRSWWLPLMVMALAGYILFGAVVQKIGIRQTVENQIRMDPKAQERMAQATPQQREQGYKISDGITEAVFVAGPLMGMLGALVFAAVLLGTINFGFGGRAKFGDVFAVVYYAWLPQLVKVLLGTAVICAGMAPESFNIKNFAPTNLGAFLDPMDTNKALYALATAFDVTTIWVVVLMSIGVATVAGVKRSAGYIVVFGWWLVIVFFSVAAAAVMG